MAEKVVTESFLRCLFLREIPEIFFLHDGQILTPAAAEFLRDRRVRVERGASSQQQDEASCRTFVFDNEVARVSQRFARPDKPVPVELSARHVHLSQADALQLFGAELTPQRELSQPGQYLANERVRLEGPRGVLENVAVLGPSRDSTQVEISLTDAKVLGVAPPVRQSGDTAGTTGLRIASERSQITLRAGLIIPGRHIHMHPDDARLFQVSDRDRIRVRVGTERALIFEEVLVRVHANYRLAMHIDFDEGNACGWAQGTTGQLLPDA